MATFGVALRATSSALLTNAQSASSAANSSNNSSTANASPPPVKEPQAPLELLACPMSLHADAIQLFCAIYDISIIRRDFNPLNGVPVPAPTNCPNSSSTCSLASLPRLLDGPAVVNGWITILKYLAWKFVPAKDNTFYPPVSAASFTASNTPSSTPTAFAIDSFLSTLEPLQSSLEALVQHQLYAFAAAGHRGSISYLRHRFDKDGGRLIPQWQQPHTPKVSPATHNAANSHPIHSNHTAKPGSAAHSHHSAHSQNVMHAHAPPQDHSRESAQFVFERNLRSLRTQLADVQNALAARNPNLTLDAAIKYLRRFEENNDASASTDIEFAYALGSSKPTLADYVLFILLNELTMLHTFLPLIQPSNSAPLFVFTDKISAWCGMRLYDIVGPTSGIAPHKSLWVSRHPILALSSSTPSAGSATNNNKKDEEKEESTSSEFSVSISAPSATSTTAPSTPSQTALSTSSPSPSPQPQSTLSAPTRSLPVPRLTSVSSVVDNRNAASSLAVEEVPDLMEYVDRIAVRARAATPAGELPAAPASPAPPSTSTSGSAASNATTSGSTSSASLSNPSSVPRKLTTLGCSRQLTQRLLDTVDASLINWKTVSEKSGIRLLTPLAESTSADHVSYRSMASTSFPVSPSILMAFLWSLDCYKLLDPNQVMDSRELAPHPNCQRAKYSYISVEMKSSSSTTAATAGARRESTDPSLAAASSNVAVAPAATAAITKVSSARFDFLLLNVWSKLLDGTYILLQQSVPDESEVNAPKKWSKGCIRASLGGCSLNKDEPLSGWVIRPYYTGDGTSPMCSVTFVQSIEFPARVGSWVSGELEKRTVATLSALRSRMKSLMGSHPLVQLAGGLESRARDATIHFRLSQAVPVSLANAVSGHGVQTTPHPKAK